MRENNRTSDIESLDEEYNKNINTIDDELERIDELRYRSRKESERIVEQVIYMTKDDEWNSKEFVYQIEAIDESFEQDVKRDTQRLIEQREMLEYEHRKAVMKIEDQYIEKSKQLEK